ncbi:MAG TPA: nucleotidyltransferase family protein [Clostridia bacterium]|nr:nucleotidyltransferase family protein [Clostridia bacterium]HPQ45936.1 nucleotidyltransferase family protein [Clostridia bacterium]HRX42057.1 nucleotidyltransferase family protein [Clostridia bacterium]
MQYDSVVLAAGYSSRAGSDKMAMTIGGSTVLGRVLDTLTEICGQIVVVAGHHRESTALIIKKYPNVTMVVNEDYDSGMFSSVKRGVSEMNHDFFLVPGDYPLIGKETYHKLMDGTGEMIVPVYNGRKGHPVLIRQNLIAPLLREPIDSNLKVFRDMQNVEYIDVDDEGILLDVDTPEDLFEIRKKAEGR